jgi:hypothetical protein
VVATVNFSFIQKQHDSQCTYNVTLRRVRKSFVPWKGNKYYIFVYMCALTRVRDCARKRVRVCSLAYPTCNTFFDIIS